MYYQPKNYVTTDVLIACAAAKRSRKKRNTVPPVTEAKQLPENTTATN